MSPESRERSRVLYENIGGDAVGRTARAAEMTQVLCENSGSESAAVSKLERRAICT